MPGVMPGIHVLSHIKQDVDGRTSGRLRPSSTGYAMTARSLRGQIRRRDQHAELPAPDDYALVVLQVDAGRDGIALAALEGAQAAEIDEHRLAEIRALADAGLGHEVDVERRAGPDLESGSRKTARS